MELFKQNFIKVSTGVVHIGTEILCEAETICRQGRFMTIIKNYGSEYNSKNEKVCKRCLFLYRHGHRAWTPNPFRGTHRSRNQIAGYGGRITNER